MVLACCANVETQKNRGPALAEQGMWWREGSLASSADRKRELALILLRTSKDVKVLAQRGSKRLSEGAWNPLGPLNREENSTNAFI